MGFNYLTGFDYLTHGFRVTTKLRRCQVRTVFPPLRWHDTWFQLNQIVCELNRFNSRLKVLHRVSSSPSGPVDPSFRALSGRLEFTVRRHQFNEDSLSFGQAVVVGGKGSFLGAVQGYLAHE